MATAFRRRGRGLGYFLKYKRDGKWVVEQTDIENKTLAKKKARAKEAAAENGLSLAGDGKWSWADAVKDITEDYSSEGRATCAKLETNLRLHLTPYFGKLKFLADIKTAHVKRYKTQRREEGASRNTINNELASLIRMFTLAGQAQRVGLKPGIKKYDTRDSAREGFFERPDFETVRDRLPAWLAPVFEFGYHTGWRVQAEVLTLEWEKHVDLVGRTVTLDKKRSKTKEGREFPYDLVPELAAVMDQQRRIADALERQGKTCRWVFHQGDGQKSLLTKSGVAIKAYRTAWRAAVQGASVKGAAYIHDLRRTAARNLIDADVPEQTAMLLTGHKTTEIFRRYNIMNITRLRKAVGKLAKHNAEQAAERLAQAEQKALDDQAAALVAAPGTTTAATEGRVH